MRVQHNIAAMNSYRNYGNNTKTINKNLEKLSSGYKINRAGDDAAGLAISEKMRAQITGLEGAQKNAKDGISLVQTAEGALTEVHSMLNRMYSLAEQSANGTYDNETDRDQLQKEVDQLRKEIDRIADSSNFNGLKLLDGSLSNTGSGAATGVPTVTGLLLENQTGSAYTLTKDFMEAVVAGDAGVNKKQGYVEGDTLKLRLTYTDQEGSIKTSTLNLTVSSSGELLTDKGTATGVSGDLADSVNGDVSLGRVYGQTDVIKAFAKAANEDGTFSQVFSMSTTSGSEGAIKAKVNDADVQIISGSINFTPGAEKSSTNFTDSLFATAYVAQDEGTATAGKDDYTETKFSDIDQGQVFSVNGKKFAFVTTQAAGATLGDQGVHTVVGDATTNADDMINLIERETGYLATKGTASIEWRTSANGTGGGGSSGGLRLQIGDTADKWNMLSVSIKDCHSAALSLGGVDISTQSGAAASMQSIKDAINSVSDVRGTLGATQNRLEHTINNLSVMQENIQDAESTIRDTDVADEMMKYTKNSILVQSAQAMLAQANQQPQGVLQLLQ